MDGRLTKEMVDRERATEDVAVSNIFRTRSVASRLSSTTSNIPIIDDAQLDSHPPHWTIDVGLAKIPSELLLQDDHDDPVAEASASHDAAFHEAVDKPPSSSLVPLMSATDAPVQPLQLPTRSTGSFVFKEGGKLLGVTSDGYPILRKTLSSSMSAGPAAASKCRWQAIGVDVYSLGTFAFKGMGGQREIAQVLPLLLDSPFGAVLPCPEARQGLLHPAGRPSAAFRQDAAA